MNYRLSIWYATTPDGEEPQVHDLTYEQVFEYVRPECGFMHDMLSLAGQGVRKLMLEVVP